MKKFILALLFFSVNAFAAPVNINTADAQAISNALNGIGIKKAEAIIDYRHKNGNYKTVNDLLNVKGIGEKTIEKNKKDILFSQSIPAKKTTPTTSPKKPTTKQPTNTTTVTTTTITTTKPVTKPTTKPKTKETPAIKNTQKPKNNLP